MPSATQICRHRAVSLPILAVAGISILLAACGSSHQAATNGTVPPAGSPTTAAGTSTTAAGSGTADTSEVTVKAASVPGVGSVLVNGDGRTLYVLATEKGGKITCTSADGCTTYWPPATLSAGTTHGIAGSGVQASLLGTATSPSGDIRLTYGGWPLYTYTGDSKAGQATGQGVKDTWGIWWVLSPSGAPIETAGSSTATTSPATTAPASGGAGF